MAAWDVATTPSTVVPSVMLIGLSPEVANECIEHFAPFGLRIFKVAHIAAACERMLTLRPLVVVIGEEPVGDALARLKDVADATGAQLVVHREQLEPDRRKLELVAALRAAVAASES